MLPIFGKIEPLIWFEPRDRTVWLDDPKTKELVQRICYNLNVTDEDSLNFLILWG